MKYLKFASVFDTDPAELALLSTFNFDPDFFERRLLRSRSLAKARRIVVFMDYGQWRQILTQDTPARWLNQRYLVVPVRRVEGVFHPKVHLLISDKGLRVSCGSGNLTRSGCTHNLELVNALSFGLESDEQIHLHTLARSTLRLFFEAATEAAGEAGSIALDWIAEVRRDFRLLGKQDQVTSGFGENPVSLIHTYDGSLWDRLETCLSNDAPTKVSVISPFYDANAEMIRRVHAAWPECKLDIVAQQGTSNLPIRAMKRFRWKPALFDIRKSRRLHAKLLVWNGHSGVSCLVGSANFTSAAFDGANVEACLYLADAEDAVSSLFDTSLPKKSISLSDFEPGSEQEPKSAPEEVIPLKLESAVLSQDRRLRLKYRHNLDPMPEPISLNLRCAGETLPRLSKSIAVKANGEAEITVPEKSLADARGTLLASLATRTTDGYFESASVWVIQEHRLTHEPSDGSGGGSQSKIRDSGEGLPEYLDEIGERGGISAMVEYLNQLNIRFFDGKGGLGLGRRFRLRRSDPFHPDVSPEWWEKGIKQADNLEQAIYEFAARHEKTRLRKHAERGNLNGMDNFLDIFTAITRLLYVYYHRNRRPHKKSKPVTYILDSEKTEENRIIEKARLIGQLCRCVQVATSGFETSNESSEGYLDSLAWNLKGHLDLLHEVCEEVNFAGHVKAALLIAQMVRFDPEERPKYGSAATRPSECLASWAKEMRTSFASAGLKQPSATRVIEALEQYHMFSEDDFLPFRQELK